jgi:hypothetical protein
VTIVDLDRVGLDRTTVDLVEPKVGVATLVIGNDAEIEACEEDS